MPKQEHTFPLWKARNTLVKIWLLGSCLPLVILIAQSILGKHEKHVQEVWGWFIPTVMPTLSLMIGVLGATALISNDDKQVRAGFYSVTKSLSLVYLSILSLTILLEPFSPNRGFELYSMAGYWLGPIQAVVVAALGYLFVAESNSGKPGSEQNGT